LPDARAEEFRGVVAAIGVIAEKIRSLVPNPDISGVMGEIGELLDRSIAAEGYIIPEGQRRVDLSQIDFEALRKQFDKERKQIKAIARELLEKVKKEKLVLDWRKRQESRAQVLVTIEKTLDKGLPEKFTRELYKQKCDVVYQHFYDSYFGEGRSVYAGE